MALSKYTVLSFIIIITNFQVTSLDHHLSHNSHSIPYAAVSLPDKKQIAAIKYPVRSANELQADEAGRITERIVRCCSSVMSCRLMAVQQQDVY